jgi:asparagine synthase (glutamine-hydrolysing)
MCGISGVVARDREHVQRTIDEQLRLLTHRGPDAAGRFGGTSGVVAQNRLAVIDLENGDPPITNEDGSVGVVLNGEIYNYQDLRERLVAGGHRLRTRGDTEVIAHLAEELDAVSVAPSRSGISAESD